MNQKGHTVQKILKLSLPPIKGKSRFHWANKSQNLELKDRSKGEIRVISTDELYGQLLKRQAKEIMRCITECQAVVMPVHLARAKDIEEQIRFAISHNRIPDDECGRSDKQLLYAHTVGDLLECLKLTREQHRAPECVSCINQDLARFERKLDIIAGAIATSPELQAKLFGGESEAV